jgi:hypothetical protein
MSPEETFLALVRAGIGHPMGELPEAIDWERMGALAEEHGLPAVLCDAVDRLVREDALSGGRAIAKQQMYDGLGAALSFEQRYEAYREAIGALAGYYAVHYLKMMVLKGYALSLDWPVPAHRPCGDIDIWLFGRYREADALLTREMKIAVDNSHHHHTVFSWHGFSVENHYDIVNVHYGHGNAEMEKIFKELAQDDSCFVEVCGSKVYLPSADFHALFLLRHAMSHFASTRLTLRQVLDWAFFVEKHTGEIDWPWLLGLLERFHMRDFYSCLRLICIDDLGFSADAFPAVDADLSLKPRVLADILCPEFQGKEPGGLLSRVWFKYRRWRANAWKHRLCYREGLLSSFLVSACAHLLKPSSI